MAGLSAEIYDNPVPHMTVKGVFGYVGIDVIPLRTDEDFLSSSSFGGD